MPETPPLTSLQLAVLRILWERGEVSVNDMVESLREMRNLAPTTVATILSRLEKRGVVKRRRVGRSFLYRSLVDIEDTRRGMVGDLTRDLFEGDVSDLVHHLLSSKEIGAGDLQKVKALIAQRESESEAGGDQ